MNHRQRRLVYYVAAFLGVVVVYTALYSWAMDVFEGRPRTFFESLLVVVETFTTTGYGEDAVWQSPQLISLMVTMQFTGVFFIFMALPLFVAPWLEERLSTTPPSAVEDATDHVVICSLTGRTRTLIEELDILEVPYVVVEPDRDAATELFEDDVPVVFGDPEAQATLAGANLGTARALVADVDDETNASIALAAREACENGDVQIITFAEEPENARYHRYAHADHVYTPRTLIGESLANKVTTGVTAEVGGAIEIGDHLEIVELPVHAGAELVGKTIGESGIRERTGVNVIGAWFRGEFVSPPSPDATIDERTILLVAGREGELEALNELTLSEQRRLRRGRVLVGGYGEVGSTVRKSISSAGIECTVIDREELPGVDVVGDVTEPEVLAEAGLSDASTVILALSDDTLAVFATLVIRQEAPDVEIIARANDEENVRKLYRAGADYVLALSTVSGRMLASTVLDGEVISFDQQVELVRQDAGNLVGRSLVDADIRARTGCTVVAVERGGEVLTDLDPTFTFKEGDDLVVTGPDQGIAEFSATFLE